MTTRITCATAKALKAFLGESAPEPMDDNDWYGRDIEGEAQYPRYALHDLLSKEFCEAFNRRFVCESNVEKANPLLMSNIAYAYYYGGLHAVEASLMEMMGKEGV